MDRKKAEAVMEAILFAMGESVEISRLAEVIEQDQETTREILQAMEARYLAEDRGIMLTQFDDAVQLCTKADKIIYLRRNNYFSSIRCFIKANISASGHYSCTVDYVTVI